MIRNGPEENAIYFLGILPGNEKHPIFNVTKSMLLYLSLSIQKESLERKKPSF